MRTLECFPLGIKGVSFSKQRVDSGDIKRGSALQQCNHAKLNDGAAHRPSAIKPAGAAQCIIRLSRGPWH